MSVMSEAVRSVMMEIPGCTVPEMMEELKSKDSINRWLDKHQDEAQAKFLRKYGLSSPEDAINHQNKDIRTNWNEYAGNRNRDRILRQNITGGVLNTPEDPNAFYIKRPPSDGSKDRTMYWLKSTSRVKDISPFVDLDGRIDEIMSSPIVLDRYFKSTVQNLEFNGQTGEKAIYEIIESDPNIFFQQVKMHPKEIKEILKDERVITATRPDVVILFEDNTAMIIEVQTAGKMLDAHHITKTVWYEFEVEKQYQCNVTQIIVLAERVRTLHSEFLHEFSKAHNNKIVGYRYSVDKNKNQYSIKIEEQI